LIQSIAAFFSAILLYILGRVSKPEHRLTIYFVGCILFVIGAAFNAVAIFIIGVILFILCLVFARPLLDIAYFPIQLKVIDIVAAKEGRNEFSYILNHEFGLYVGRLFGCGLFIVLAQICQRICSTEICTCYSLLFYI
jgi:YQGE family putative transporter